MGLDIIEIALDGLTDFTDFEKLASEVMRDEGYHNIKPLGGPKDKGRDAILEEYYVSEGKVVTVFQYTLEQYLPGKIDDTIGRLLECGIEYQSLVIVTPKSIGTGGQDAMKIDVRKKYGISLEIYERKTLVNRLASPDNPIFSRHFPDIEKQARDLVAGRSIQSQGDKQISESAMLKTSVAFTFNRDAPKVRKSVFDWLVLGLLLDSPEQKATVAELVTSFKGSIGGKDTSVDQVRASVGRLIQDGMVKQLNDHMEASELAVSAAAGSLVRAKESKRSLVSDIVDQVRRISQTRIAEQQERIMARNVQEVLVRFFQLAGIELSNKILVDRTPGPEYLDSLDELVRIAKLQLPNTLGELVLAQISVTLKQPTQEQAEILTNWSLAYLGAEIMSLDPNLREFQLTKLATKVFILDTDFILDCLVSEYPGSRVYLELARTLAGYGCRLVIPPSCLQECVIHAKNAYRTYNHFKEKLLSLSPAMVDEKVWNVFVRGYYYGRVSGMVSRSTAFAEYIGNYYEASAPIAFIKEVIRATFPLNIKVDDPVSLFNCDLPGDRIMQLSDVLLEYVRHSKKSEFRSDVENKELATNDAKLFLCGLKLNDRESIPSGEVLAGGCHIITSSSTYLRSARQLGIRDILTTRPQSILGVLELIGGIRISPTEFAQLFENPLLSYAVNQAWDDAKVLLDSGIVLRDKSIARLRRDLDQGLHDRLNALEMAEHAMESSEDMPASGADQEYVALIRSASERGYRRIPEVENLIQDIDKVQGDATEKAIAYDKLMERYQKLEEAVEFFGKRRQKYLKRVAGGKPKR